MTKIKLDLSSVPHCSKRGCHYTGLMHRHHTSHQWMFIKAFEVEHRKRRIYKRLVQRYSAFLPEDIELLCPGHHGEIHELYDDIVQNHCRRRRKPLQYFIWKEARQLMASLKRKYYKWVEVETNDSNPATTRLASWEQPNS